MVTLYLPPPHVAVSLPPLKPAGLSLLLCLLACVWVLPSGFFSFLLWRCTGLHWIIDLSNHVVNVSLTALIAVSGSRAPHNQLAKSYTDVNHSRDPMQPCTSKSSEGSTH